MGLHGNLCPHPQSLPHLQVVNRIKNSSCLSKTLVKHSGGEPPLFSFQQLMRFLVARPSHSSFHLHVPQIQGSTGHGPSSFFPGPITWRKTLGLKLQLHSSSLKVSIWWPVQLDTHPPWGSFKEYNTQRQSRDWFLFSRAGLLNLAEGRGQN